MILRVVDSSDITISVFNEYSTTVMRVDVMRLYYLVTIGEFDLKLLSKVRARADHRL